MLTGKALFNTLVAELNDMGLPGMSSTLDEMYRSAYFVKLDPLMAIAMLVEPEYQKKITKRIQGRLRSAHLRGCPQELSNCVDSAERAYLPYGITEVLSTLDFIDSGLSRASARLSDTFLPSESSFRSDFTSSRGIPSTIHDSSSKVSAGK